VGSLDQEVKVPIRNESARSFIHSLLLMRSL
jgi:hypothetical protein